MASDDDKRTDTGSSGVDSFFRKVARAEPRDPVAKSEVSGGDAESLLGAVLDGKYRLDALLGRGGMGTVYRATHLGTARAVALKVLVPKLTANDAAVERFRREARTAGQMRHPNVVDVTDFGFAEREGERFAYLVMELLHGRTLRAVLDAEGPLPLGVVIDVLDQVCAAVAEAHAFGVLHRDLKPENLHLGPGARGRYHVKVLDFGIAKLLQLAPGERSTRPPAGVSPLVVDPSLAATLPADSTGAASTQPLGDGDVSLTRLGAAIGTPRSPEQWLGQAIDARSDIYSLGVVAYEMLTGEPPFLGKERPIALEHAELAPPPLAAKAPTVPRSIAKVVEGALAKDPAARPQSAAVFAAALQAGTETTFTLLRRSMALSTDHLALLSRRCILATLPPVAFAAIGVATEFSARGLGVSTRLEAVIGYSAEAASWALAAFVWGPVSGLMVPLVGDLMLLPTSSRPPPPPAELWRTFRSSLAYPLLLMAIVCVSMVVGSQLSSLARHAGIDARVVPLVAFPTVFVLIFGAIAPFPVTYAAVAVERKRGLAGLRRSMALLRTMWRAAFGVQLLYATLTMLAPEIALLLLGEMANRLHAGQAGLAMLFEDERLRWLLFLLVSGALTPFAAVPLAMLYLRAREAEGTGVRSLPP